MTQLPKDEELHRIEAAREQAQREMFASIERQRTEQAEAQADGIPALMRLVEIAHLRGAGDTSQNHHVRRFLLGLYNGSRWPFDMTRLRCIDADLQRDALAVLRMDVNPAKEVHCYIEGGTKLFNSWWEAEDAHDAWQKKQAEEG